MKLLNFSRLKSNKNKIVKIILFIIVLIFVIYLISPKIIGQIDLSSSIKTSRKCLGKKFAGPAYIDTLYISCIGVPYGETQLVQ